MRKWIVIVLLAFAVNLIYTALTPEEGHSDANRVSAVLGLANQKWGPLCGDTGVIARRGDLPSGILARASYNHPLEFPDDAQQYFNCIITIKHGRIPWPLFCTIIIHEAGHLAGYRAPPGRESIKADGTLDNHHSSNPKSIMYARQETIWRGCRG